MSTLVKAFLLVLLILVALANSVFVISEFERGVKLRFGELVEADLKPGIHVKIPIAEDVRVFDGRILTVDAQPASFFHHRKKASDCRFLRKVADTGCRHLLQIHRRHRVVGSKPISEAR
jgi:regulator of protease activity HflC (stomatin/prohibitin superfamily)